MLLIWLLVHPASVLIEVSFDRSMIIHAIQDTSGAYRTKS